LPAALRSSSAPSAAAFLLQTSLSLPPNPPKPSAASSARGGGESQELGLGSAGKSRWAAGETPKGVGSKARLPAAAAGSLPRLGAASTARASAESQRARACWRSGLVSHVAKLSGLGCEQVSAAKLLGRAAKFTSRKVAKPQSPKKQRKAANRTLPNQKSAFVCGHPRPIFIHCLAFFPRRLVHNQVFNPFFSSSARSAPMQWANICAQGTG